MKKSILSRLFALAFFGLNLIISQQAQAGATLRASDLVVVDYQSDDTDGFKVLVLAPIPANSVLFFTDAQWLADGNLSAVNQGNTEWQLRWTSPASVVPAGTIITFTVPPASATADLGTITTIATTLAPNGGLTLSGDQLVIYQTDDNTPSLLSSKIQRLNSGGTPEAGPIYSFNADNALTNNAWSAQVNGWGTVPNPIQANPGVSPSGSHTPPNSVVFDNSGDPNRIAANAFGLGSFDVTNIVTLLGAKDLDNLRYNGAVTAADKTAWLIRIHNPANWIGREDVPWGSGQGTLSDVTSAPVGSVTAPTVTTPTQTAITSTTATLGGNVTADGGSSITARGVVFAQTSLNANPQIGGASVTNLPHGSNSTGIFTVDATSLTPGTQYSFAAYATNSTGPTYTTPVSTFTTLPAPVAVTSLTRSNGSPTNASTVNWTLTFAGPVSGLTASNFSLTGAAATGSVVGTPTTSNNIAWGIPVTTGSTDGTLTLNLANATGLSTTISTALPFAGDSYTIDKTAPTVLSVTRLSPSGQNTNLTTVTFRVTYSEPVALNNPETARFQVVPVNGSTIVGTVTGVTGSTNTRDVTVNLTSGTGEFKLRVID